jgi:hypothetical protein
MVPIQFSPNDVSPAVAANTAAVRAYPADGTGRSHVIVGIWWSYSGTGTLAGGNIQVADGPTVVHDQDITSMGPGEIWLGWRQGSPNQALTITLAAGGANVVGKCGGLCHFTTQGQPIGPDSQYPGVGLADFSDPNNSFMAEVLL